MKLLRGWTWLLIIVLLAFSASICLAQETVKLEYKFTPGQTDKYVIYINGNGNVTTEPAMPQMPPSVSMAIDGSVNFIEKTVAVNPDGSGTLEMSMPSMTLNMDAMGQKVKLLLNKGDMSMVVNGAEQPFPMGNMSQLPLVGTPLKVTMTKLGKVTGFDMAGLQGLTQLMGNMDFSQMLPVNQNVFPDHALKVGDSWKTETKVPLPGMQSAEPIAVTTFYKLEGIENQDGKQVARLAMKAIATAKDLKMSPTGAQPQGMPAMNMTIDEMTENLTGRYWFSIMDGQMEKMTMSVAVKQVTSIDTSQGPQKTNIDMNLKGTVNRQ